MTGHFVAPDANGLETIWLRTDREPEAVLTRDDLPIGADHLWPLIVKAVTA